jgi:hypothetical protein
MLIRGAALVILLLACIACGNSTSFVLANDTNDIIASATVQLKRASVELGQIEPGGRAAGTLAIGGDDDYHITVRFQSGRVLDKRLGYVTSGVDFHDEFSVSETDISLKRSSVE